MLKNLLLVNMIVASQFWSLSANASKICTRMAKEGYTQSARNLIELQPLFPPGVFTLDSFLGLKGLDIGTGQGSLVFQLRKKGVDIIGFDIHVPPYLWKSSFKDAFVEGDIAEGTIFEDESFDFLISTVSIFSYEHENIQLMTDAIRECSRILKKGGRLYIAPTNIKNIAEALKKVDGLAFADVGACENCVVLVKR